jgi:surface antigen
MNLQKNFTRMTLVVFLGTLLALLLQTLLFAYPGNDFSRGQCTWWVWEVWPKDFGRPPFRTEGEVNHAYTWLNRAERNNWLTGTIPRAGAIAVWGKGVAKADADAGHVAYVLKVDPNNPNRFYVTESNWIKLTVGERWVDWVPGINFIYPSPKIEIRASGVPALGIWPNMILKINGAWQAEWVVDGGFKPYITKTAISPGDTVSIEFTNDFFAPWRGLDRNLIVDYVKIGDAIIQAEDPYVAYQIWGSNTIPGQEMLNKNGALKFTFLKKPEDTVEFKAAGILANQIAFNDPQPLAPVPIPVRPPVPAWIQDYSFRSLPPMPNNRIFAAAVESGGKIYIIGGDPTSSNEIVEFDPQSQSFNVAGRLADGRRNAASVTIDGKIYTIAGDWVNYKLNSIEAWSPGNGRAQVIGVTLDTSRTMLCAASHNGLIYVFGGDGFHFSTRLVEVIDPRSGRWRKASDMPTGRRWARAVLLGDKIYVIGGEDHWSGVTAAVEEFDPNTWQWRSVSPLPSPRHLHSAVALNGKIYVFGGIGGDRSTSSPDVFEYNPGTNTWKKIAEMPEPRSMHISCAVNGKIYIVGGRNQEGGAPPTLEFTPRAIAAPVRDDAVGVVASEFPNQTVQGKAGNLIKVHKTQLFQNYPNPFNPETWIPYQLKETADVKIRIYDSAGRSIRLLNLGSKEQGVYLSKEGSAYWDGRDSSSNPVPSGVYFYTIEAGSYTATKKLTILK